MREAEEADTTMAERDLLPQHICHRCVLELLDRMVQDEEEMLRAREYV